MTISFKFVGFLLPVPGVEPGFPVGGVPTLQEGAPTYKFAKNIQKTA